MPEATLKWKDTLPSSWGMSLSGRDHWNYQHGHCTKEARKQTADGNAHIKQLEQLAIGLGMIEPKRGLGIRCLDVFELIVVRVFASPCKEEKCHQEWHVTSASMVVILQMLK